MTDTTTTDAERAAREIGTEHGRNAASWVELDEATAEQIDRDGWGDVFADMSGPLSGEWADGYTLDALYVDSGLVESPDDLDDHEQMIRDDLASAYEDAYWQAFGDEIERKVELLRGPPVQVPLYGAVRVEGWAGTAFRYVSHTFGGKAIVVMIGDDREHIVDPEDLTHIDEDDYCHECGQVGCTADGRDRT
jgi:hypothetical protein